MAANQKSCRVHWFCHFSPFSMHARWQSKVRVKWNYEIAQFTTSARVRLTWVSLLIFLDSQCKVLLSGSLESTFSSLAAVLAWSTCLNENTAKVCSVSGTVQYSDCRVRWTNLKTPSPWQIARTAEEEVIHLLPTKQRKGFCKNKILPNVFDC